MYILIRKTDEYHSHTDKEVLGRCSEVPTIDMLYSILGERPVSVTLSVEPPLTLVTLGLKPDRISE